MRKAPVSIIFSEGSPFRADLLCFPDYHPCSNCLKIFVSTRIVYLRIIYAIRSYYEGKPVEGVGAHGQQIRLVLDDGKFGLAEQFDGHPPLEGGEVQFHELGEPGEVGHDEDQLLLVAAEERKDLGVLRVEKFDRSAAERPESYIFV